MDDLVYVVRDDHGEITDVGVEEFVEIERVNRRYLKITLRGLNETRPLKLMVESESPVTLRRFGEKA